MKLKSMGHEAFRIIPPQYIFLELFWFTTDLFLSFANLYLIYNCLTVNLRNTFNHFNIYLFHFSSIKKIKNTF